MCDLQVEHETPQRPQQTQTGGNDDGDPDQHRQPQRRVGNKLERERERDDDDADNKDNKDSRAITRILNIKTLAAIRACRRKCEKAGKDRALPAAYAPAFKAGAKR